MTHATQPILTVDAGSMLAPSHFVAENERSQRQVKAELLLEAVAQIGVDAMTVGEAEFTFGKDFLLGQAKALNLPYVCANLVEAGSGQPVFPASLVKEVGAIKVGVLGLTSSDLKVEGLQATEPVAAAQRAVEELKRQGAGFIVALSNQPLSANEALAKAVPEIQVIVAGSSRQKLDTPRIVGNAAILEASSRGKFLGLFEANVVSGGSGWQDTGSNEKGEERISRFRNRIQDLQKRLGDARDDRERERLQRQLEFYEKELARETPPKVQSEHPHSFKNQQAALAQGIVDDPAVKALVTKALERIANPSGATAAAQGAAVPTADGSAMTSIQAMGDFIGAQACQACHPSQYAQWKSTPHASAYASVQKDNRHMDFQCYSCHVTGHGKPGGPSSPTTVGPLTDVQCESCHEAGRAHAADPVANRLPVKTPEAVCLSCHTKEQTEGRFVYSTYLPKVVHGASGAAATGGRTAP